MNTLDWIVLSLTLAFIVIYGTVKTRSQQSLDTYLKGGNKMNWLTIGLSVMATQASAITFLSTPGLAFDKGLSFVQNYFGLPLAIIIVAAFFIPVYYRLKVFTAYEYLEQRFDLKMRLFTAGLFLIQRGLAAGITIYAPAIILHTALDWDLNYTILAVGVLVIIYTVSGGTRAVSYTQKWQMSIILLGMAGVFTYLLWEVHKNIGVDWGLKLAGQLGRMDAVSFSLDPSERYTFWTGITGGLFLALSYFGTDQSQVQRYLGGKNPEAGKMGLMFNAILKIPMQFFILLTGVLLFLFFQFNERPLLFNQTAEKELIQIDNGEYLSKAKEQYSLDWNYKQEILEMRELNMINQESARVKIENLDRKMADQKEEVMEKYREVHKGSIARESDYVFLYFILNYLPHGIIGLLLCVIISAAMSSTSGEINALAATTSVDFYRRLRNTELRHKHELLMSKIFTLLWGVFAILFALFAQLVENLIEAVNILGSLFYGTILGVFIVGMFIKKISAFPVFVSAIISQLSVIALFVFFREEVAYLWYNIIAAVGVLVISLILQLFVKTNTNAKI